MHIELVKSYLPVEYDDDDKLIRLMLDAVLDEMEELIAGFNRKKPTNRQKLLICAYVKDLYDNRGKFTGESAKEKMHFCVQSMMLKEQLRGMTS